MIAAVRGLEEVGRFVETSKPKHLHVWQRDTDVTGENGFEPGPTELSAEVRGALLDCFTVGGLSEADHATPLKTSSGSESPPTAPGINWALDIVIVDPDQWWIGCHPVTSRQSRWPGGVPPISLPEHAVSRAYLKMEEALRWSGLPTQKEDLWVELGCAPGGASQALLDQGMIVVGVDPAEVAPAVAEHPRFAHARRRVRDLPTKWLREVQWIAADMNVAPSYTLDAVEGVLERRASTIRGMVLTLKLSEWSVADSLPEHIRRVRSWGYRDVRLRQLAFNRREVCLVALRSRAQRRIRRGRTSSRR